MSLLQDWQLISQLSYGHGLRKNLALLRMLRLSPLKIKVGASVLREIPIHVRHLFKKKFEEQEYGSTAGKYFDIVPHVIRAVSDAEKHGLLDTTSPCRILDLGTGFGYFPFVCRALGHSSFSVDWEAKSTYGFAREKLGIETVQWEITPQDPLPAFKQRFDLITAFQPTFFLYQLGQYGEPWRNELWDEFFLNLKDALELHGKFYLGANNMFWAKRSSTLAMWRYFKKRGGKRVSDGWVFEKNSL
ncbi:hypothetical protein ACMAY5_11685 [Arenicellales bacterium nBUS_48]|jgi:hypothetical protein